jgi:hypothetical protein
VVVTFYVSEVFSFLSFLFIYFFKLGINTAKNQVDGFCFESQTAPKGTLLILPWRQSKKKKKSQAPSSIRVHISLSPDRAGRS